MSGHILKRLFQFAKGQLGLIWAIGLGSFVSAACVLVAPVMIGRLIDRFAAPSAAPFDGIGEALLFLACVYICAAFCSWLAGYSGARAAFHITGVLRERLFSKLNSLPLSAIDSRPRGDIISRFVNDADAVSTGLFQGLITLCSGIVTIILAIIIMLSINPFMTAVVAASGPLTLFISWLTARKSRKYFKEQADTVGEFNAFAEETIQGLKVVWTFGRERKAADRCEAINSRLRDAGIKAQFISSFANPTSRLVNNFIYTFVGVIAGLEALYGNITIGDIPSFLIFSAIFAKPFNELTGILTQAQAALASARRVFDILDLPSEPPDKADGALPMNVSGRVSFRDVCFSYAPGVSVIDKLNLEAEAGSVIAITGVTGAGKTTLVNLLTRFYEIESGKILIDGVDIRDIPRDRLRGLFGVVLQDTWLFQGSVRDNIAYGNPDASIEQIISAAREVGADDFISKLENGYDTVLRDAGENLSQGQRQLLAIARVMLTDPPILILDEATSNIDALTELQAQRAFFKMAKGKTCFIIAHRLSTIRSADRILFMEKGRVSDEKHTFSQ